MAFFFPSLLRFLNLRSNFRNHRKIAVVNGKAGFIGGFNIGDEYLGKVKKWGYWRDAAVRIEGTAVLPCQLRFFFDWNYATKGERLDYKHRYFPDIASSSGGRADSLRRAGHLLESDKRGLPKDDQFCY